MPTHGSFQPNAAALPGAVWDALVIGAGPAGAMAAIHLADHGHRVLLLEKYPFPRDKTCGDGLIADALSPLGEVGLDAVVRSAGRTLAGISIFSASGIEFTVPGDCVTLRRRDLDALLVQRAVEGGAAFAQGEALDLVLSERGLLQCELAGGKSLRCRVALVATGVDVRILERMGLATSPEVSGFAVRQYIRSDQALDHMVVSFDQAVTPGYGWIFPLGDGVFNVGCGVVADNSGEKRLNLRQAYEHFLQHFKPARELIARGKAVSSLRGSRLRCGLGDAPAVHGRTLIAGDALGSTLPFTGEGIGKAMQTGRAAAMAMHEALAAGDPARLGQYQAWLERELRPLYQDYHCAQRWFVRSWVNDLVARRIHRSRYLQKAFAGLLNESVRPGAIFSLGGLVRSFLM